MKIGVIGLGERITGVMKFMQGHCEDFCVTAIADIDHEGALRRIEKTPKLFSSQVQYYKSADEMLSSEELTGVFIGTRCSLHTKMAEKVIRKGLTLYLEKPVSISMEEACILSGLQKEYDPQVMVSFPLRASPLATLAREIVASGKIGSVEHIEAYNYVPYGRVYYHDWYRDEAETGGLWLQKATHDLDYLSFVSGQKPIQVCAMNSKQIFKGNEPAGLTCEKCPKSKDCPEGPYHIEKMYADALRGPYCCFAEDTGNEDSGSAIIRYANGMHGVYTQNFFARHKAAKRGARFTGYKGTLEFDWYTNELKVYMHTTPRVDTYSYAGSAMSHFGGDDVLAANFIGMLCGKEKSISTLKDGVQSALMCLAAKKSCQTNAFCDIPSIDQL